MATVAAAFAAVWPAALALPTSSLSPPPSRPLSLWLYSVASVQLPTSAPTPPRALAIVDVGTSSLLLLDASGPP